MSKLILAVTGFKKLPGGPDITRSQTIVVESDKMVVLPREDDTKATVFANGYEFYVDAEVAEIASAMSATDASSYT